jgi:hypothetical protein
MTLTLESATSHLLDIEREEAGVTHRSDASLCSDHMVVLSFPAYLDILHLRRT